MTKPPLPESAAIETPPGFSAAAKQVAHDIQSPIALLRVLIKQESTSDDIKEALKLAVNKLRNASDQLLDWVKSKDDNTP